MVKLYFSLSMNHLSFSRNKYRVLLPIRISYLLPTPPTMLFIGIDPEITFVISNLSFPFADSQIMAVGIIDPSFVHITSTSTYFFFIRLQILAPFSFSIHDCLAMWASITFSGYSKSTQIALAFRQYEISTH